MVSPKNKMRMRKVSLVLVLGAALVSLCAAVAVTVDYSPLNKEYYLTAQQVAFIRPGLVLELRELTIPADLHPVVEFSIQDPAGLPLDIDGIYTPGPVSVTFIISRIPEGETQHVNYNTRTRTGPDGEPVVQADRDRGGTFSEVADGVYTYRFNDALPTNLDREAPHTIGAYARRDLREFELERYADNDFFHFLPTEVEVSLLDGPPRDVVPTEACNQCHDPLAFHGGSRLEVAMCIQCHTPQSTDDATGNTVDFKVMIHKIHRGENLPSVEAGEPYLIGNRDYSDVAFPQDIRNCGTCHAEEAVQHESYLLNPTRDACGSCHDNVVWKSGENHLGGPQISDNLCAFCHFPEGELEFDSSVKGAHTIESKSRQLAGVNIEILDVADTGPGQAPVVLFSLTNDDGSPVDILDMNRVRFQLSGPTDDYSFHVTETATDASVPLGDGEYTFSLETVIPEDAKGSFAIGAEARRYVLLNPGTTGEFEYREQARNTPVFYFPVTDGEAVQRRMIVASEKCNECHEDLAFHGSNRRNPGEYCQMCHRPGQADEEGRTVDFKMMIHRIHAGHDLENEYEVGGRNYNELHYPGDRRNCEKCHVDNSYEEAQGNLDTVTLHEFFSPMPPNTTACIGCHDGKATQAHAYLQIAPFGEACMACHGDGNEAGVARVHAR